MALKVQEGMGAVLVLMIMVWGGAWAQSSTCTSSLMGLSPCLNFVTGNSSTPSPTCCSQLATVVQTQPRCLCSLLNGNIPNIGITINQTLAVTLPGACRVQTPPITLCNGVANGPAGEPASAPTSSAIVPTGSTDPSTEPSNGTPEVQAPTSSLTPRVPSGSKATPSANNSPSDGNKFGAPTYLLLLVLLLGMKF
ncbi:hypothetical protein R6Q59_017362 [Mikania micrantha]|uniref:Bifunctional inhibitor/plant lipid transfer protein/seed storage helical domain-containing protein n=1 Tax=Mikania micrantha TaxID=192012 RepID=A0A5N6M4W9_9ASTR|nr:hypothetical protein E3N88_36496 [Mikania micrantha]